MPPPQLPRIKKNNGIQANANTSRHRSRDRDWSGTYHFHTIIQVVTPQGVVVGEANCRRNNNYVVQITTPQTVGIHEFRLQAVDDGGHVSRHR